MTEILIIVAMLIGIAIGRLWNMQGKPRERKGNRARERPSEDEERQAERVAREYANFWNYTGDPQDDIQ